MKVYLESNFVLEIALGQEQASAAEAILNRAEQGEVSLALPAFSLSEPFAAIRRRANDTQRLGNELRRQLNELGRSDPHHEDVRELRSMTTYLESIELRELERLTATVHRLLPVAHVVPFDATTFSESLTLMAQLGLSHQDAVVYSSVRRDIGTGQDRGPHFFVNRDKHFSVPWIRNELASVDCDLVTSFEEFALRLEQAPLG